eukprot:675000-Rhodomonas_salina.1
MGFELTIAVQDGDTLQTACDRHFAPEPVDGSCTLCGAGHIGTRHLTVAVLLPVLTIQLRRYMTDSVVNVCESLCTDTWLPAGAQRLHLSAVVCHQGGLNGPC